ncbi:cellulose binding domain-containing protein, partial [Streptomyces sp. NPDC052127]|uniref:cellulose binding domain-containing protein n=1 Tax=Streptomyces sp. NPDC052127 TaxID=3155679 RepID=UPI0034121CEC
MQLGHQDQGERDLRHVEAEHVDHNAAALNSWNLTFDFADGQKVTQGWSAKWSQS